MNYVSIILCHFSNRDNDNKELRSEMLKKSLESLWKTIDYPAELIVVDNGGNPDDSDYLLGKTREGLINTYLRNKENMYFGWAWNQGVKLATGNYVCLTCNDIEYKDNWLSKSIYPLFKRPREKWVASPLMGKPKYDVDTFEDYRINLWAGSNCMILSKKLFYRIGEFTTHHLAGSVWQTKLLKMGYRTIIPKEPLAIDIGTRRGLNDKKQIKVIKTLLNNTKVDYSHPYNIVTHNFGTTKI